MNSQFVEPGKTMIKVAFSLLFLVIYVTNINYILIAPKLDTINMLKYYNH